MPTFITPLLGPADSESDVSVYRITILGDFVRIVSTNRAAYVYHGRSFDGSLAATWGSDYSVPIVYASAPSAWFRLASANGLYSSLG